MKSITLSYEDYKQILRDLDTATMGWDHAIDREREASCEVGGELDEMRSEDLRKVIDLRLRLQEYLNRN